MSVALDVNVLLYASDESSDLNQLARHLVETVATGPDIFYLFWPVAVSYVRIATHPRIFDAPLDPASALHNVAAMIQRPHVRTASEGPRFWETFQEQVGRVRARGNLVSDAYLVALMRQQGVRTVWSRDRDFRKFDGIEAVDPFDA